MDGIQYVAMKKYSRRLKDRRVIRNNNISTFDTQKSFMISNEFLVKPLGSHGLPYEAFSIPCFYILAFHCHSVAKRNLAKKHLAVKYGK